MRRLAGWAPVAIWMGLIFHLSSLSNLPQIARGALGEAINYSAHFLEYGVLTLLLYRALAQIGASSRAPVTALLSLAYAFSDEIHQLYVPNRTSSLWDVAADLLGSIVFLWIATVVYQKR